VIIALASLGRALFAAAFAGDRPSALTSTLTSSAASFTAGGVGVTLTFTALDINSNPVEGFTPEPEGSVV
jgi:hypothetical protein